MKVDQWNDVTIEEENKEEKEEEEREKKKRIWKDENESLEMKIEAKTERREEEEGDEEEKGKEEKIKKIAKIAFDQRKLKK